MQMKYPELSESKCYMYHCGDETMILMYTFCMIVFSHSYFLLSLYNYFSFVKMDAIYSCDTSFEHYTLDPFYVVDFLFRSFLLKTKKKYLSLWYK